MANDVLPLVAVGDPDAVKECIARYGGLVFGIAMRHLGNRSDAEDAVQDIFLDIWRSAENHDPTLGSELVFISTIARRRLIDRRRRAAARISADALSTEVVIPESVDLVELRDEFGKAQALLASCKPEQRQSIELCVMNGYTHEEAAVELGLPLGTLKSYVRRGLNKLRAMLRSSAASSTVEEALP